jgi:uncharacterized protein
MDREDAPEETGRGCAGREFSGIREHVRGVLTRQGSHGMDHIDRVTALCERIGREEHADMDILIPAALLHDIARPLEKQHGIPHHEEGARMAASYLSSIGYDKSKIPAIVSAIRTHRFKSAERPETLEAQILSDADKLDALGAVGIARTFMRAGEHGTSMADGVRHFHDKLLKLPGLMHTRTGQRFARDRHAFLREFLERIGDETGEPAI